MFLYFKLRLMQSTSEQESDVLHYNVQHGWKNNANVYVTTMVNCCFSSQSLHPHFVRAYNCTPESRCSIKHISMNQSSGRHILHNL